MFISASFHWYTYISVDQTYCGFEIDSMLIINGYVCSSTLIMFEIMFTYYYTLDHISFITIEYIQTKNLNIFAKENLYTVRWDHK